MVTQYTPRLGLSLEDNNELIDPFVANWTKLDSTAGVFYVNDGVTPDATLLYDGAQIIEKNSGKMFVMHRNTLGNFDKINTRYPYYYSASQAQSAIISSTSWRQWGMGTFNSANAVNSSASDMFKPSNGWRCPVDGIYSIKSRYRWQDGTSNTGARGARVDINSGYWTGVWDTEVLQTRNPGYAVATDIAMITPCRAGDTLVFWSYQDTGQNLLMNSFVSIAMIHALPYYPVP